jgi:sulfur carrier protein ThiS
VKIAINGEQYEVHEGLTAVDRLKRIADIPLGDVLDKEEQGHLDPLPVHGEVQVHAGDVFLSHKRLVKITINGKHHDVHEGLTRVENLKRIAEIPLHDLLEKEAHGHPEPLPDHGEVDVHGGNVFISHKRAVKIKINNVDYETHPGENSVNHLKHLGHVPEDEILSEFKDGQFVDLADNANVMIHGGEVFAGHRKSGGSS